MIRTIEDFVRNEYPNHELSGSGADRPLSPFTAVAEFRTSTLQSATMSHLRESFDAEHVSVIVATPPATSVVRRGKEDTESMADVPKRRPLVGAIGLGAVALAVVAVVTLIIGAHPAVIVISALFAGILGGIIGAISFGGARFAGEKAWDQQNVPGEPIQVAAVFSSTEPQALEACKTLSAAGATTVRIVSDTGAWHLPNLYTTSE
jgi:hypothetical protein